MDQSNPGIRQFFQGTLPAFFAPLYQQPGAQNQRSVIKHIAICNQDAVAHTVFLFVVKKGDSAATFNVVFAGHSVGANASEFYEWGNGGMAIEPGGYIAGAADVIDKVCLTISGVEYF